MRDVFEIHTVTFLGKEKPPGVPHPEPPAAGPAETPDEPEGDGAHADQDVRRDRPRELGDPLPARHPGQPADELQPDLHQARHLRLRLYRAYLGGDGRNGDREVERSPTSGGSAGETPALSLMSRLHAEPAR